MAPAVYVLSTFVCVACAVLLFRGYWHSQARLLLWSALCFVGLSVNNAILFVDLVVLPEVDLSLWRGLAAVVGVTLLTYGMIWDTD